MKTNYFLITSIILMLLSILGFSDNLFTDVGQKSNSDPKFVIHGLFCFAWIIILVIQSNYIRKGNYKAHMTLGISGLISAIGVFLTTLYIFAVVYKGWDAMSILVKANRFFILAFATMVTLGYLKRRNSGSHKRYMYIATLYMLGPILDRAMGRSFLDSMIEEPLIWDITFHSIWTFFFISLFMYDWATLKKIHPVTYSGLIVYGLIWLLSCTI